ncbi:MAG: hypothetical protein GKS03_06175 [Alphaproteobacteria bacterium]|nr:hypothetical protein [Alphaproteobacteria bacterium]
MVSPLTATLQQAAACHGSGRLAEAERGYRQILLDHPEHPETLHLLGVLLGQSTDLQAGIQLIKKAVDIQPNFPKALYNLGLLLQKSDQTYLAALAYTRTVRLEPTRAQAWHNMSMCFSDFGQTDSALATLEEGILSNPESEILYAGACRLLKRTGHYSDCVAMADRGISHLPNSLGLWIHRAEACFALGRFDEAWDAYSWRKNAPENPNAAPKYSLPFWHGEDLAESTILVWTEQGPGETFLFSTTLNEIIAVSKKCIVATTKRLLPILARSFPGAEVVDGATLDLNSTGADIQSSLLDLCRPLRRSWNDFPDLSPHIKADQKRVDEFSHHYQRDENNPLVVGIAWRSFNVNNAAEKSVPLDLWRPILSVPGVRFVSLQYGDVKNEVKQIESTLGIRIQSEPALDPVADLDGHLAQIANLDLVISTSNTTAHAAAALGIPTWLLAPHTIGEGLHWPWFAGRQTSPWYQSLTLYRQEEIGDWTSPLVRVAIDLSALRADKHPEFDSTLHLVALAYAYHQAGQDEAARLTADQALQNGYQSVDVSRIAARGFRQAGDPHKALDILNEANKLDSDSVMVLIDRAEVFKDLDEITRSIEDLEQALQINSDQLEALNNLARARRATGESQLGLELIRRAHALSPDHPGVRQSLGTFLSELGLMDEAESVFKQLIDDDQNVVDAASSLSMAFLLEGNFDEGWPLLHYRLAKPTANIRYDHFQFPIWAGEDVRDKHVLVWTEQGIGEEILVATMLGELSQRAKAVTVRCSARMVPLLQRSFSGIRVAERKQPLPAEAVDADIDVQMSFVDLGQFLRPSLDAFPQTNTKPVLKVKTQESKKIARKYRQSSPSPTLVGLSWHSNTPEFGELKSLDPSIATSLIANTNATFVSLQYAPQPDHLEILSKADSKRWIFDPTVDPIVDMDRAAAQVAAMNFVVTISNTAAHTAGALGIPTALLVPRYTGRFWYWFRGQARSPWYPSVQIYEADENGNWDEALAEITRRINTSAEFV